MEQRGRFIGGSFAFVSNEKFTSDLKTNSASPGDIIVTQRGTLGQVSIIPDQDTVPKYVVSQSQMAISVDPAVASRDFVYYYLKSPIFADHLENTMIQAGVPHINLGILRETPVNWPDVLVQRQIAKPLVALDDKIELNRRMNETLEAMARAVFKDWFVDFGPTRRKAAGETDPVAILGGLLPDPAKAAELAALFPESLGGNDLPGGWSLERVDQHLELAYGKALTKKNRIDGDCPVYGSGGISGTHNIPLAVGPGIIVGRKGTVGSLFWEDRDFYAIDTVFYVVPKTHLSFLYYLLQTLGLEQMNTDAAVPGLNRNNVYRLERAFGCEGTRKAFANLVDQFRTLIRNNEQENQTLAATRDLLLPKLMSGEIRLKDAEDAA